MDDWIRYINPDAIPDSGYLIGRIGKFRLIITKLKVFKIVSDGGFDNLSTPDLDQLKELVELCHEWSVFHKFSI